MRTLLHAIGMFMFGGLCLFAMGAAFDSRVSTPLPLPELNVPVPTGGLVVRRIGAMNVALRGVSATMTAAADALAGDGRRPALLLDGAWRVAQVIEYVGARAGDRALRERIESARVALQDGDRTAAGRAARDAAHLADTLAPATLVLVPATTPTYRGAEVLDALGNRLGTIAAVDDERVVLESPSLRHVLGFITVRRGELRSLRRDAVLLGEPRRVGDTLAVAVIPTPSGGA